MLDARIDWFHEFADLSQEQLMIEATAQNRAALSSLVEACLHEKPEFHTLSPQDFAEYVIGLRANERLWNHALCNALIEADDLSQAEGKKAAASALRSFAESCPWSQFRQLALIQAASYDRRH